MDKMDPMKAAANVSKLILETERVRVLGATFKPGDVAKMHRHPDHVMYVLKGGKFKMTSEGKANEMDVTAGQAVFLKAQDHEVENVGKTTIDIIVVELKK
jgi:quercetin dioxygenase-like cupin family protein